MEQHDVAVLLERIEILQKQNEVIQKQIDEIQRQNDEIQKQNDEITKQNKELEFENAKLKEENRILKQRNFGRKSERLLYDDDSPSLFDEAELAACMPQETNPPEETVVEVTIHKQTYKRRKPGRKPIDPQLPRVVIDYTMSEAQQEQYRDYTITELGIEKRERLYEIPAQYIVIERHVHKYKAEQLQANGGQIQEFFTAAVPEDFLPKSIATPGLLAHVITGKYCEGLPLERQEHSFARHGVCLPKQTMANWCIEAAKKLDPVIQQFTELLFQSPALNCDETPFIVMNEPGRANTAKSYMIALAGGGTNPAKPKVVLYRYSPSKSAQSLEMILKDYHGAIQSDAYKGYTSITEQKKQIHAGCWAHARRKFHDAWIASAKKGKAEEMLTLIRKLYDVESSLRLKYHCETKPDWDTKGFLQERKQCAAPVLEEIHVWLLDVYKREPPKTSLGEAVTYTLNEWERLTAYLEVPWFTPDNNVVERAIRPFTVGRKNWVISGSPRGAYASAILYSIVETAKSNDINPYYYFRYLFEQLPVTPEEDIERLMPWNLDAGELAQAFAKEDAIISLKAKSSNQ